jgi:hypothetical protein
VTEQLQCLQDQLSPIYNPTRRWSYEEQCLCLELLRVPNWQDEVNAVLGYWHALPAQQKHLFPQTMTRLLSDWTGVLDKAAVAKRQAALPPEVTAAQKILWNTDLKRIEAAQKKMRAGYDSHTTWSKEDREQMTRWKARRTELMNLLGFTV